MVADLQAHPSSGRHAAPETVRSAFPLAAARRQLTRSPGRHAVPDGAPDRRPIAAPHRTPWTERGRGLPITALGAATFALVTLSGFVAVTGFDAPAAPVTSTAVAAPPAAGPQPLPPLPQVRPVGLAVPSIGVAEDQLVDLARGPAGELETPVDYARAGWFAGGAVPGSSGPAVIAGHVDSRSGPAVFYRLRDLSPGDAIDVTLSDGTVAAFVVDTVQQYPKNAFPTNAVYGPVPGSALRLITCGGTFDEAARSYRDNVVVYASQVR